MKKKMFLCVLALLTFFAVGCTKVIDLTDEESKMIAEYAGELLIKYDRNIKEKYDNSFIKEDETTAATTETATEAGTEESVSTEELTEEAATTEAATQEQPNDAVDVDNVDSDVTSGYNLAEFLGENNVNINYSYYMILSTYPSYDKEGVFIEIEAPAGYKLIVLKFEMENKTNEAQYIDLYSKDVKYNIILNNKKSAKQMFTILLDDMYTYQDTLDASSREEIVLIYQISEELTDDISDLKLKIQYNGAEKVMQLQ